MRHKHLTMLFTAILALSLASCGLPVMTPPATEIVPSVTPAIQIPPTPSTSTEVPISPPERITDANVGLVSLTQKAAVSNVQEITWALDSQALSLVTQNSDSSGNQIYGVTTLNALDLSTRSVFSSQDDRVVSVAPDGHTVALISKDLQSYSLVDTDQNNQIILAATPGYLVGNISFSPDLKYIALTKQEAWEVVLFDFSSHKEVRTLSGFETAAPVFNAQFLQSPQWMTWHARATIQVQEVETGVMGQVFSHEDFVNVYALSPDGTLLASAAGKTVNNNFVQVVSIWDTSSGSEIRTLALSSPANAMQFSPDGKLLALSIGNDLQIWDPAAGTILATLSGHSDFITRLAFSPDQTTIATAGLDNQLYLWQVTR